MKEGDSLAIHKGAIVIDTKIDENNIDIAFNDLEKHTQSLINKYNKAVDGIKSQELALEKVKQKIELIKNGNIVPPSLKELEKQLNQNNKELKKVEDRINTLKNKERTTLLEDTELLKLEQAQKELSQINNEIRLEMITTRESCSEVQTLNSNLEIMKSKLEESKRQARNLSVELENAFEEEADLLSQSDEDTDVLSEKIDNISEGIKKLGKRITNLILSAFVFNVLSSGLRNLQNKTIALLKTNAQFQASLNQIKANLMTAFAPIYNACLPAINALMTALSKITGTIAVFVSSLFGISLKDATKQAQGLSNALKETSSAGEEAAGSLGSFDKLEVIGSDSSSGGGSNASAVPEIDYSGEIQYSEKLLSVLNKIKDAIKPVYDFFKKIYDKHGPWVTAIVAIGAAFLGWLVLKTVSSLLKKLISNLFTSKKTVDEVGTSLTGFFDGLGKATEAIAILGGLALVIKSITGLIVAFSDSGLSLGAMAGMLGIILGELVGAFILLLGAMKLLEPGWQGIAAAAVVLAGLALVIHEVTGLITALGESGLSTGEIFGDLTAILLLVVGVITALTIAATALGSNPLALIAVLALAVALSAILIVIKDTLPVILSAISKFITAVAPSLIKMLQVIFLGISEIANIIGKNLTNVVNSIGVLFEKIFRGISQLIESSGNILIKVLNTLSSLTTTVLFSILNFINCLGPATNNFVNNAISAVTKLVNFMISAIEYLVNTLVVGGVNKIIKSINKIGDYVGITIPTVPTMSIPRFIPKLANGAVIPPRQEFMAILGDQKHGKNIEAPLKTIEEALENVLNRKGMSNEEKEIVLKDWKLIFQMGTKTAQQFVIDCIRMFEKETGQTLLFS